MKILLDAGHGAGSAFNRGAIVGNEGDNNYHYSLVLKKELERYKNVEVDLTRKKITDNPSLNERSKMGKDCDLFLSLHSNASDNSKVRGTEIWDSVENPSKTLASKLCNAIANTFNHSNRGVKYKKNSKGLNWYGVLRNNNAKSAMLIEHGFHTNSVDSKFYVDERKKIARVTAKVIATYYDLELKSTKQTKVETIKEEKGSDNLYKVQTGAFTNKANAKKLAKQLQSDGYDVYIVSDGVQDQAPKQKTEAQKNKLAKDIALGINGWSGVYGKARESKVEAMGYDYKDIQARVNKLV